MPMKQYEADQQRKLFQWTTFIRTEYPEVDLMFHIPNGGSRNKLEAANLKRQGVKAGVPDLFLPVSRGGYHGLFIELKYGKTSQPKNKPNGLKALMNKATLSLYVMVATRQAKRY